LSIKRVEGEEVKPDRPPVPLTPPAEAESDASPSESAAAGDDGAEVQPEADGVRADEALAAAGPEAEAGLAAEAPTGVETTEAEAPVERELGLSDDVFPAGVEVDDDPVVDEA
jgi:hypothetical protein